MPRPLRLLALAAIVVPLAACGGHASPTTSAAQTRFGVKMAERGLWSEAWFRFQQARSLGADRDPEVLNNLAVAAEALGRFDEALELYRQALTLAPGNAELKGNYDRFVGFYESFKAQEEAGAPAAEAPAAATPAEPPADFGTPAPAPAAGAPDAPAGGVATEPLPVPVPAAPAQPPPQPSDSDEPPPSDPEPPSPSGGSQHG